jgi:hypothetical protein
MDNKEFEKAKPLTAAEIIEYVPNGVVFKSILKKTTGHISLVSIDTCDPMIDEISPFDTFVQIIDGNAEFLIDGVSNMLEKGQSIILPAHSSNTVKARIRFKMISTTIKSGYE